MSDLNQRLLEYILRKQSLPIESLLYPYLSLGSFDRIADIHQEDNVRYMEFRCRTATFDRHKERKALRIIQKSSPSASDWQWARVLLDGSFSEAELFGFIDESWEIAHSEYKKRESSVIAVIDSDLPFRQAFRSLAEIHGLSNRYSELEALVQPEIQLIPYPFVDSQLNSGQSRLGGLPDLPEGWAYPQFNNRPLVFLAQINLSEMPSSIHSEPLPSQGILYFFSMFGWLIADEDSDVPWRQADDSGFTKVLYFDGDMNSLKPTVNPDGLKTLEVMGVQFREAPSIPAHHDISIRNLKWSKEEELAYFELRFAWDQRDKLLGYPNAMQGSFLTQDTRLLCELGYLLEQAAAYLTISFVIPKADLERLDFGSVKSVYQAAN